LKYQSQEKNHKAHSSVQNEGNQGRRHVLDDKGEPTINISGSIYLRKSALGGVPPQVMTVTDEG
jgi:hypothetical protein